MDAGISSLPRVTSDHVRGQRVHPARPVGRERRARLGPPTGGGVVDPHHPHPLRTRLRQ